MKFITLLTSFAFFCSYYAFSQSLVVTYEETRVISLPTDVFSQIDNPISRAIIENSMRENVSGSRSQTTHLLLNDSVSLYKTAIFHNQHTEKISDEVEIESTPTRFDGSIDIRVVDTRPLAVYKDRRNALKWSPIITSEKKYFIEEPLTKLKWKIGREKKEILGYECIKATTKTTNKSNVIAWYAPDIPISDGPSDYWGLPGLILHLEIGEMRIFSCSSIEEIEEAMIIEAPNQGEKISKKQYDKMIEEEVQRRRTEIEERNQGRPGTVRSGRTTIIR